MVDEKQLLSDTSKTNKEISEILGCSVVTVTRKRRKYNIVVPRGLKPGQHNNVLTKYIKCCKMCGTEFATVPSANKTYCSKECVFLDDDYINLLKCVDKSYMQTEKYKKTLLKDDTPEYRRFRNRVTKLTEKVYRENVESLNPNGFKRTISGIDDGYQLDHILSVRRCFDLGMTPEETSSVDNLQLLPWKQNLLKR